MTLKAYGNFTGQSGPDKGAGSSVYMAAWAFFKKREMRGISTKAKSAKKAKTDAAGKDAIPSVENVELDGEKEDAVPVFGKPIAQASGTC